MTNILHLLALVSAPDVSRVLHGLMVGEAAQLGPLMHRLQSSTAQSTLGWMLDRQTHCSHSRLSLSDGVVHHSA